MAIGALAQIGIGVGFGVLKNLLVDKPREERDRRLRATQAQIAPFTGRGPQAAIPQSSLLGSASTFGLAALAQGQNIAQAKANNELQRAQIKFLESQSKAGGNKDLANQIVAPVQPQANAEDLAFANPFAQIGGFA